MSEKRRAYQKEYKKRYDANNLQQNPWNWLISQ
jgi:hypothetical protein